MADSTVIAVPTAIKLWFSTPVQVNVTTVRVIAANGDTVETARPVAGTGPGNPVVADIKGRVPVGRAEVAWRTMSRDGHVVSGRFTFTLADEHAH